MSLPYNTKAQSSAILETTRLEIEASIPGLVGDAQPFTDTQEDRLKDLVYENLTKSLTVSPTTIIVSVILTLS